MCGWAVVSTCTGAVQDYKGLLALRFILGFVEAPFFREQHVLVLSVRLLMVICSRGIIPLLVMVHQERVSSPHLHPLRCRSDIGCVWRVARQCYHVRHEWQGRSASLEMAMYDPESDSRANIQILTMGSYHRGRRNNPRCRRCYICPARLPGHHQVAHRRRTDTRHRATGRGSERE